MGNLILITACDCNLLCCYSGAPGPSPTPPPPTTPTWWRTGPGSTTTSSPASRRGRCRAAGATTCRRTRSWKSRNWWRRELRTACISCDVKFTFIVSFYFTHLWYNLYDCWNFILCYCYQWIGIHVRFPTLLLLSGVQTYGESLVIVEFADLEF